MRALPGRPHALCAVHQVVDQAAMPGFSGLQRYVETQSSIGADRRCAISIASTDNHLTAKILIDITDAQHLPLGRPRRRNATAPHNAVAFHLEDVCEIATDCDLEIETHGVWGVIRDLNILVKAAIDMAANHQA